METDLKRTVNQNKCQSKLTDQEQNRYLQYLINPSFQRVNRLFVLLFENRTDRKVNRKYYIPKVEIKDYNVITDEKNFFDKPIRNALKVFDNIATGQRDDQTIGYLLSQPFFKEHYKLMAINLSQQKKLDVELKPIQKINFTGNQINKKKCNYIFHY